MSTTSTTPTLEQPPPLPMIQQAYTSHSGHGSVGPVIGVLAVIIVLGALAVMVGRICSGRRIMGRGQYDFESWVEAKFATCIDGRVDPPRPRVVVGPPVEAVPGEQEAGEVRKDEEMGQPDNPHEREGS